jgi:hypothetical protein
MSSCAGQIESGQGFGDVHVDTDPGIGGVFVGFSLLCYFDEVTQSVTNVFEGFIIPVVLRQGVESDPNMGTQVKSSLSGLKRFVQFLKV